MDLSLPQTVTASGPPADSIQAPLMSHIQFIVVQVQIPCRSLKLMVLSVPSFLKLTRYAKSFSGTCMVQVDLAGPRLPQTFSYSPSEIRRMAFNLLDGCVIPDKVGGFITSDLKDMQNYLTADGIRLNRPFRTSRLKTLILAYNSRQGEISNTLLGRRLTLETLPATSTAFLTVTVSSIVPEWLSPGDFDPIVPHQLAWVVGAAAEKELDQRKRVDLRWRELKLDQRIPKMTPRGGRVAWWDFSDLGEEPDGTSLDTGDQIGPVDTLEPLASSASSTTSRRRRSRR